MRKRQNGQRRAKCVFKTHFNFCKLTGQLSYFFMVDEFITGEA